MKILNDEVIYGNSNDVKFFQNSLQVFYISQPIYNVFQLILADNLKFIPNDIYKELNFSQTLL